MSLQRSVVDAGPFIDSITGVEADLFRRDSPQRMVERFDRSLGDLPSFSETQRRILAVDFRKPGVVDLQDEAGIDDRLILGPQSVADCLQVLFVAAVVLVAANPAGRHGRHESFLDFQPAERGLEIIDIFADRLLSSIADRPGAHQRDARRDASAHHAPAEVLLIVLREGGHFRGPLFPTPALRALRLKAGEPLAHVGEEARLSLLAVGHNIDTVVSLLADNLGTALRAAQRRRSRRRARL